MYLATEYFVRTGRIKKLLQLPCSLFVASIEDNDKKVITLHPSADNQLLVKHWYVSRCSVDQMLPSMFEYLIDASSVFDNYHVVIPRHKLLQYYEEPVPHQLNTTFHPMASEIYSSYADGYFNSKGHTKLKEIWLWRTFIRIYVENLWNIMKAYSIDKSPIDTANDQQLIVQKHFPDRWNCWKKWRKYLLDFSGPAGELIFMKEYAKFSSSFSSSVVHLA